MARDRKARGGNHCKEISNKEMTQVLELSDKNFKITMTNRLKYQLEKIGNLNRWGISTEMWKL